MREIVLIGSGPAAISAAHAYRAAGGEARVRIVGAEPQRPYERPPLSKAFMRGEAAVGSFDLEVDPAADLLLGVPATSIERGRVVLRDGHVLECDACLLATGSQPLRIPVEGAGDPAVLTLRSLADAELIAGRARAGTSAAVIGSGFIGCELAASLAIRGVDVTLVTDEPAPMAQRLGDAAAARIESWLEDCGVRLILSASVEAIESACRVVLAGAPSVRVDLVVLATGSAPHGALADGYGAAMNDGAVRVDAAMRADDFLLAAGDVAYAHNAAAGRALRVEHWGEAIRQGEVAGRTLAGVHDAWDSLPGFWSTIGEHTLKYRAWGDGYDESEIVEQPTGAWTVFHRLGSGETVGVLTHEDDETYERAAELVLP